MDLPEEEVLRSEMSRVIRDAVSKLPPPERALVELQFLQPASCAPLTVAEIGRVLGVDRTTVRYRLDKALALLRAQLAPG